MHYLNHEPTKKISLLKVRVQHTWRASHSKIPYLKLTVDIRATQLLLFIRLTSNPSQNKTNS